MLKILPIVLYLLLFMQPLKADNQQALLDTILNDFLIADSQQAVRELQQLESSLRSYQQTTDKHSKAHIQQQFKNFVLSWKRVETLYVAGALNEDYLDHPRFIDYYNQGNESISDLVQRALDSEQVLANALFKNSTKSVNALEYLLFSPLNKQSVYSGRQVEAALLAITHIGQWLTEIVEYYQSDTVFKRDAKKSLSLVVNRLIDSSYRLTYWRIGEAGGLIKKYQGKPSVSRLEYHYSSMSLNAILEILKTHLRIIKNEAGNDLLTLGQQRGVASEMRFVLQKVEQAIATAQALPRPFQEQIDTDAYHLLFKQVNEIHNAYYFMLIDALGLNSQIIDADGD